MSISRHILFGKLGASLYSAVESAAVICRLRGNPYIELAHWLHQLQTGSDNDWQRVMCHFNIVERVEHDIVAALAALPSGATAIQDFSAHIETAIERAWVVTTLAASEQRIRGGWLIVALLETPELRRVLRGISTAFDVIPERDLLAVLRPLLHSSPESGEVAHDVRALALALPQGAGSPAPSPTVANQAGSSALEKFCQDLTQQARDGRIDPVVGREHEIGALLDILQRRRQNNPLLTGAAGVGKTAVVEGLALALVQARVPPVLAQVRLLSLDVGALLAGTGMKGEFEARLKSLLEEACAATVPVILFIDEVHTLVGAGGQAGTGDAANLLKPALARGNLRTIGATTWSEYKRHIEKDPALTRRFQVLQVQEPAPAIAVDMVRALVPAFAAHHRVWILDAATRAAVALSQRYIPARQLPDKAISLLDTACARVALSMHAPPARLQYLREQLTALQFESELLANDASIGHADPSRQSEIAQRVSLHREQLQALESHWQKESELVREIARLRVELENLPSETASQNARNIHLEALESLTQQLQQRQQVEQSRPLVHAQVDEAVVADIVAEWTGIPVGGLVFDELDAVLRLPQVMMQRVIFQDHALLQIGQCIQTARVGLGDPDKPVGVFLLVGPSGVGKTETAQALAQALYGGEQSLITVNLSEYQEAHTVSTLKGAPPGYVGYGEGGVLTEAVRRRPYSIVLLDEIEKAHADVHELFYQVFDKGWMEDGEGRAIDFRNTIILMTSNVGAETIVRLVEQHPAVSIDMLVQSLQPVLRQVFPVAFLGRIRTIPYFPLANNALMQITRLQLEKIRRRMLQHQGIQLDFSDAAVSSIVEQCACAESGARLMVSFIERHLLTELSRCWLNALQKKQHIESIRVDVENAHGTSGFIFQLDGAIDA
jgi:type VI secretion system protein VasG